ncbi:MAG: hypothetical protein ACKVK0_14985, partial [Pirellulales bacterium]
IQVFEWTADAGTKVSIVKAPQPPNWFWLGQGGRHSNRTGTSKCSCLISSEFAVVDGDAAHVSLAVLAVIVVEEPDGFL